MMGIVSRNRACELLVVLLSSGVRVQGSRKCEVLRTC